MQFTAASLLLLLGSSSLTAFAAAKLDDSTPTWPAGTYAHYPAHVHCPDGTGNYHNRHFWFDRVRLKEAVRTAVPDGDGGFYVGDAKNRFSKHISVGFDKQGGGLYQFRKAWNKDTGKPCHPIG